MNRCHNCTIELRSNGGLVCSTSITWGRTVDFQNTGGKRIGQGQNLSNIFELDSKSIRLTANGAFINAQRIKTDSVDQIIIRANERSIRVFQVSAIGKKTDSDQNSSTDEKADSDQSTSTDERANSDQDSSTEEKAHSNQDSSTGRRSGSDQGSTMGKKAGSDQRSEKNSSMKDLLTGGD